jgi:hypothetical protein
MPAPTAKAAEAIGSAEVKPCARDGDRSKKRTDRQGAEPQEGRQSPRRRTLRSWAALETRPLATFHPLEAHAREHPVGSVPG